MQYLPTDFIEKVRVQPNGCWYWKGGRVNNNPIYTSGSVSVAAFIFAWMSKYGPLPDDEKLQRACDGIGCANPDHRVVAPRGVHSRMKAKAHRRRREAREHFQAMAAKYGL